MHRDRLMAIFSPQSREELPDGSTVIEDRGFDYERGVSVVRHELVDPGGRRLAASYECRSYTVGELVSLLHVAGYDDVVCHGDFDRTPVSRDTRLVLVAGYAQNSAATAT
jgi:hypothetical protein